MSQVKWTEMAYERGSDAGCPYASATYAISYWPETDIALHPVIR